MRNLGYKDEEKVIIKSQISEKGQEKIAQEEQNDAPQPQ
jgi:hypothetical protein